MLTGIVDHRIDPLGMFFAQKIREILDTLLLTDIQRVELDRRISSILS